MSVGGDRETGCWGAVDETSVCMPEEEVTGRLDIPSENEITISQVEGEDYGPLWTIDEYWYDGATLYFTATAPQKVIDAGNLLVVSSDHADVNGTDCFLYEDGCWEKNTGKYRGAGGPLQSP